jgi:benzoate/toluate 1,2-dioxygenase subunit beta
VPSALDVELREAAVELLLEEADRLDERRWRDWLELYEEEAVYWAPAWDDDHVLIDDPHTALSLIYCGSRERLEDRVWRMESGLSSSLLRLPRTRHFVTNIRVRDATPGQVTVTANFQVNTYKHEERHTDMFFGHYRYQLGRHADGLRIREKYIVVCNDVIPRQMDVFNV